MITPERLQEIKRVYNIPGDYEFPDGDMAMMAGDVCELIAAVECAEKVIDNLYAVNTNIRRGAENQGELLQLSLANVDRLNEVNKRRRSWLRRKPI